MMMYWNNGAMKRAKQHAERAGFTLVELMCAMAILLLIGVLVGRIFVGSERIWTRTTIRVDKNRDGRAALEMIAHDLSHAVAAAERDWSDNETTLTFIMRPDREGLSTFGFTNGEICFVSLQHNSQTSDRTAREIHYYAKETDTEYRYELRRGYWAGQISETAGEAFKKHCYWNPDWYETGAPNPGRPTFNSPIIENVAAVAFFAPDGTEYYDSRDHTNRLPAYVDIYLEVFGEREADELAQLVNIDPNFDPTAYVERNAQRYTTQVFFHNWQGYKKRW